MPRATRQSAAPCQLAIDARSIRSAQSTSRVSGRPVQSNLARVTQNTRCQQRVSTYPSEVARICEGALLQASRIGRASNGSHGSTYFCGVLLRYLVLLSFVRERRYGEGKSRRPAAVGLQARSFLQKG